MSESTSDSVALRAFLATRQFKGNAYAALRASLEECDALSARCAAQAAALALIADEPFTVLPGVDGEHYRCRHCGYWWRHGEPERHHEHCAGLIARAARVVVEGGAHE